MGSRAQYAERQLLPPTDCASKPVIKYSKRLYAAVTWTKQCSLCRVVGGNGDDTHVKMRSGLVKGCPGTDDGHRMMVMMMVVETMVNLGLGSANTHGNVVGAQRLDSYVWGTAKAIS